MLTYSWRSRGLGGGHEVRKERSLVGGVHEVKKGCSLVGGGHEV